MIRLANPFCATFGNWCVCIVVAISSRLYADERDNPQTTESESSCEGDAELAFEPRVKWEQIWFMDDGPKRVKIALYDMKSVDEQVLLEGRQGLGLAGEQGLTFETRDPTILAVFSSGLTLPLRVAIPDEPGYGAGGGGAWPVLGHIEVFTRKESFIIGIHLGGFSLGSEHLRQQNKFFSWKIAQQLDDILFLETRRHIPRRIRRGLSGEAYIESQKRNYELILSDELIRKEQIEAQKEKGAQPEQEKGTGVD